MYYKILLFVIFRQNSKIFRDNTLTIWIFIFLQLITIYVQNIFIQMFLSNGITLHGGKENVAPSTLLTLGNRGQSALIEANMCQRGTTAPPFYFILFLFLFLKF